MAEPEWSASRKILRPQQCGSAYELLVKHVVVVVDVHAGMVEKEAVLDRTRRGPEEVVPNRDIAGGGVEIDHSERVFLDAV